MTPSPCVARHYFFLLRISKFLSFAVFSFFSTLAPAYAGPPSCFEYEYTKEVKNRIGKKLLKANLLKGDIQEEMNHLAFFDMGESSFYESLYFFQEKNGLFPSGYLNEITFKTLFGETEPYKGVKVEIFLYENDNSEWIDYCYYTLCQNWKYSREFLVRAQEKLYQNPEILEIIKEASEYSGQVYPPKVTGQFDRTTELALDVFQNREAKKGTDIYQNEYVSVFEPRTVSALFKDEKPPAGISKVDNPLGLSSRDWAKIEPICLKKNE